MRKNIRISCILIVIMLLAAGCGGNADKKEEELIVEDFDALTRDDRTQVIVRDEPVTTEAETAVQETEDSAESEIETETVVPYADRVAGDNSVTYNIETAVYEEGAVRIAYPQLTSMADGQKQQQINESIRQTVTGSIFAENLSSYELTYETATKGDGIVSFIFRGTEYYTNSAYPDNIIKTLNIDLNTGKNVRFKDFADLASVVSSLELADGYTIMNEGVDMADFSAYLNNGSVTDYAMTLLDYDIDFENPEMIPTGYSAIRDNHLILFIEAEHAMGDYVELEFRKNL
ncbi:MAG: hypothetical protein K2K74_05890 [Lachnospiraceae bacterium]|nr:hypothetical protein [Lachnospiraceae bacterium]